MPVSMITVERQWPAHLPPPSPGTLSHGPRPAPVSPTFKRHLLEIYAQRMRMGLTKSTRGEETVIAPYIPATLPPVVNRKLLMTRQCFVCGRWCWCSHREPELADLWEMPKASEK